MAAGAQPAGRAPAGSQREWLRGQDYAGAWRTQCQQRLQLRITFAAAGTLALLREGQAILPCSCLVTKPGSVRRAWYAGSDGKTNSSYDSGRLGLPVGNQWQRNRT